MVWLKNLGAVFQPMRTNPIAHSHTISCAVSVLQEVAGNSDCLITLFDPVVIDWPEKIILAFQQSFENCFIHEGNFV